MATPYPLALRHFPALRQSTLARFADCQLSAGFELSLALVKPGEYLHRSGWTTARQAAGRIIHATLARALRHMVERGEERIPVEVVLDLYDDELRQATTPVGETFALPAHEDALARRTLRKWARDNSFTIADVAGIEDRLDGAVSYPDGAGGTLERVLTGQLDLLLIDPTGRHATVVDWKDTWKLPAKRGTDDDEYDDAEDDDADDRLSLEGYFQQRFYALLVFQRYPSVQSVTLREFYIRRSKPREATLWRHELPHLLAYLGSMAERFDRCYTEAMLTPRGRARRRPLTTPAQWGEPSPGAHCSYCPKALDCPLDRDAREGGAITTPQEAVRFAGALLVAKRAAKQVERSIRTWNDREGPVRVRDGKRDRFFGFVESERVERPTRRAVEEAMLAGRSPLDLFKRKVSTRFTDYSPDQDVTVGLDENDVVEMFERAAEEAQRRRTRRGRRRTTA
jgi:hypothetical protein